MLCSRRQAAAARIDWPPAAAGRPAPCSRTLRARRTRKTATDGYQTNSDGRRLLRRWRSRRAPRTVRNTLRTRARARARNADGLGARYGRYKIVKINFYTIIVRLTRIPYTRTCVFCVIQQLLLYYNII